MLRFGSISLSFWIYCGSSISAFATAESRGRWLDLHYVRDCSIFNWEGQLILRLPSGYCLYTADGKLVLGNASELAMYDANDTKLWSLPGRIHHQINWSRDQKSILALASDYFVHEGRKIRQDVFLKVGLDGKILARSSAKNVFEFYKEPLKFRAFTWDPKLAERASEEISHFNSIYEIPENALSQKNPAFKSGNMVVNDNEGDIVILSPDLKKPLFRIKPAESLSRHDVQVLPSGNLLFFNNLNADIAKGPYSSIDLVDPVRGKRIEQFVANPPQIYYSKIAGGVQVLGKRLLLVSHMSQGLFILDWKTKQLIASNELISGFVVGQPQPAVTQQFYGLDLKEFLKARGHK